MLEYGEGYRSLMRKCQYELIGRANRVVGSATLAYLLQTLCNEQATSSCNGRQ